MRIEPDPKSVPETAPDTRRVGGLGVSAGIAIGPAHVIESGFEQVPEYVMIPDEIPSERDRFASAVAKSLRQVRKLKAHGLTHSLETGYRLSPRGLQVLDDPEPP